MHTKKGFTLLELLIVIGILAILSTTIVLVINPAELLRKARDSQRISDLNTMKTAIAYYITEVADPELGTVYTSKTYSDVGGVLCAANGPASSTPTFAVNGTGWIPIEFTKITGGAPIGSLPADPNASLSADNAVYHYAYLVSSSTNSTFKLTAKMESIYYSNEGDGDVESKDGGVNDDIYEVGTDMTIPIVPDTTCYNGTE